MTPLARGFVGGAVLASAGMLALPEAFRLALRDGRQGEGRHVAEFVVVDTGRPDFLAWGIQADGKIVPRKHVALDAFGMDADRYESREFLPRRFTVSVRGVERAMVAEERLCPIVVLATPDEIRISPCLARVVGK